MLDQNGGPTDSDGGRMWPIHIRPDSGKLTGTQVPQYKRMVRVRVSYP